MKKLIAILALIILVVLANCTGKPKSEIPYASPSSTVTVDDGQINNSADDTQIKNPADEAQLDEQESETEEQVNRDVFSGIYALYQQAVKEMWDGGKLIENSMSLMMLDCYGASPVNNIGYTYKDLDGNGREELVVALTDAFTDDYYGKLVLDVYSIDDNGNVVQVFSSGDRNRYYYAGSNLFANIGSSSASDSVNTTLKLEGIEMIDTGTITEPADYQQIQLNIFD